MEIPLIGKEQKYCTSWFARIFFFDSYPLLKRSNRETLENDMIPDLKQQDQGKYVFERFQQNFQTHINEKRALLKAIMSTFKSQIIWTYIILFLDNIVIMYTPVQIHKTIEYISDDEQDLYKGILLILEITLIRMLDTMLSQNGNFMLSKLGNDQLSALSIFMMKKSLSVSFLSNKQYQTGEILNLMQVDISRVLTLNVALSTVVFTPFQLTLAIYLVWQYIGISFLAGLGAMILTMMGTFALGRIGWDLQRRLMIAKDLRTKQAHEIFSSIKFVKVNSYEDYFKQKLSLLRDEETRLIRNRGLVYCVMICFTYLSPQIILNATLATYVLLGNNLNPANVFSLISVFAILQNSVNQLPQCVNQVIESQISINRLQEFFKTQQMQLDCLTTDRTEQSIIKIKGTFNWGKNIKPQENQGKDKGKDKGKNKQQSVVVPEEEAPLLDTLKSINLEIEQGSFTIIMGDVGSGKTSLLQAILGEMQYQDQNNEIHVGGEISYVSQKSWIQNATLKENILFGKEYDEKRYKDALHYSCLELDIKILDKGENTMIGEKGVNLSGGQKARISIARAIYSNSDIFLLDDPISAVDIHVGKFIMEQCLIRFLRGKTILLITHALNYCQYADRILLMENGQIVEDGDFQTIKTSQRFWNVFEKFSKKDGEHEEVHEIVDQKQIIMKKQISSQIVQAQDRDEIDDLMLQEDRQKGSIPIDVYKQFFRMNGGWPFFIAVFLVQVGQTTGKIVSTIWLAEWSNEENLTGQENLNALYIFTAFSLGTGVFALMRTSSACVRLTGTARVIHNKMINALMDASLCKFFERIPLGVLMNRLTKDMQVIDSEIFFSVSVLYVNCFNLVGNLFLNFYGSTYIILLPTLIFFYAVWKVRTFYMTCNRELYRLESISKSPILSYFSETVNGITTIRAYNKQEQFIERHTENIDLNRKIQLAQITTGLWFSMMLTFLSYIVNISAITYAVLFGHDNPALAGLLMTAASQLDMSLRNTIQNLSFFETRLISFERCYAFTKISPEPGVVQQNYIRNWPYIGQIEFNNLFVKYRENLQPALKGLTLNIQSQEKIGVVGRTGAGKSTITLALLRILESHSGQILVDGVDIAQLSLKQLRTSITMILQDSVLFQGNLRDNLDPLKQHNDQEIINIAKQCCLEELILQRQGLDTQIQDQGDNLSAGEKQLIAIARAVLKQSPIVLIDEATANIDIETESKIQETIHRAFKKCTVITIAHRINTIMMSDKILVIDKGQAVEFDNPQNLLLNKDSLFYQIRQETLNQKK